MLAPSMCGYQPMHVPRQAGRILYVDSGNPRELIGGGVKNVDEFDRVLIEAEIDLKMLASTQP